MRTLLDRLKLCYLYDLVHKKGSHDTNQILSTNYFLIDLTIEQADTLHSFFFGGVFEMENLYKLWEDQD